MTGFWAFRGDGAENGQDFILSYTEIKQKAKQILFSSAESHLMFSLLDKDANQTEIMALDINGPRFFFKSNDEEKE